jgi:hypothetical protein
MLEAYTLPGRWRPAPGGCGAPRGAAGRKAPIWYLDPHCLLCTDRGEDPACAIAGGWPPGCATCGPRCRWWQRFTALSGPGGRWIVSHMGAFYIIKIIEREAAESAAARRRPDDDGALDATGSNPPSSGGSSPRCATAPRVPRPEPAGAAGGWAARRGRIRRAPRPACPGVERRPRTPPSRWCRAVRGCVVPGEPRRSTRRSRFGPGSEGWA